MKYSELFILNPIETIIKINDADNNEKAKQLVSTFVITSSLGEAITNVALPQLDLDNRIEGKGLYIVGNYGTGKSHVMSFLSIIAENVEYLQYVRDDDYREKLRNIAGKYKVRRHQIAGTKMALYDIVAEQLSLLANDLGFNFRFKPTTEISNVKNEFQRFIEAFDQKYPNQGVLLIIDELLHYLETRNDQDLALDLSVLQALGEFCDGSRFVFMAGLQQSLFNNPRFHHMAAAINRVKQRYYDFVIDNKGVAQLIEQYLFNKTNEQKNQIRKLLEKQFPLYEILTSEIDQFVALFPAHPRFIDEFQRVFVVERREILTILSQEARKLLSEEITEGKFELITADKYWNHIERDQGLRANHEVSKVIQNIATITSHIKNNFGPNEDKIGAIKLIHGLAVNRLTTYNINEPVGLTPADLKNNLLWHTPIAMEDSNFLTLAAKRLLDRTREASNGQFLTVAKESGQYYIDPTRVTDYEQRVNTYCKTLSKDVVQRYINEIYTRALEIDNEHSVIEGRLWEYQLLWAEKNVERPGWLFFGFPNQRSTAQPPKDFYIFIIPSERITGMKESWIDNPDESYWLIENFPVAKYEHPELGTREDEPDTFLDQLRKYAAACELASPCRGDEKLAYERIAKKLLGIILPTFSENAGEWITIQFNGQKKKFCEWITELAPAQQMALYKTKVNSVCHTMFSTHFEQKYPDYPKFSISIQEGTRAQNVQSALEIVCGAGYITNAGKAILKALELYDDVTPTPERSPWLTRVRNKLNTLEEGQILNNSDLFEQREGRTWMKGESIEAEWLHVVLAAGIEAGYLIINGPNNSKYDAGNLREFYQNIKNWEQIIRIGKPIGPPIEKWRNLFGILNVNKGLLATSNTHSQAITEFQNKLSEKVLELVEQGNKFKGQLPFLNDPKDKSSIENQAQNFEQAKQILESLQPLNSRARMANLRLENEEIDRLDTLLKSCNNLGKLLHFIQEYSLQLAALERYEGILEPLHNDSFHNTLEQFKIRVIDAYKTPNLFNDTSQLTTLTNYLNATIEKALDTYQQFYKLHSLDREGDLRKKRLLQGKELQHLNKLSLIKALNRPALEEIHNRLTNLPIYQNCTNDELLKSPTSLCPYTKFDPRLFVESEPAFKILEDCEKSIERLHLEWAAQLLKELKDPATISTLGALKIEEKQIIEEFLKAEELPATISDAFISAVNTVLSGLKRKPIKATEFAKQVMGTDGTPLKPDELRQRFEKWLKEQMGSDQPETVRFVLGD